MFNISRIFTKPLDLQNNKINIEQPKKEKPSIFTQGGGFDIVSFSPNTNPDNNIGYQDILEEFVEKYGEGRSLEQAKLGVEYMNKILKCKDLPRNKRADFEAQKQKYEMMVVEFQNYEKMGSGEKVSDVWKELENFVNQYKKNPEGASKHTGIEYWLSYHESCISFYQRLLQCEDLTEDLKVEYNRMIQEHINDKNRIINERDNRTNTFQEAYNEMMQNVPDRTTTVKEKEAAIYYINKMLTSSDISNDLKIYWENKKNIIEMEIMNINNNNKIGTGETIEEVTQEWNLFVSKNWDNFWDGPADKLNNEELKENRLTYYRTYLSFCERFLACTDITNEQRSEYYRMMSNAHQDIANWQK